MGGQYVAMGQKGQRSCAGMVYIVWLSVVVVLYPACQWFADLKRRRRDAWLSNF